MLASVVDPERHSLGAPREMVDLKRRVLEVEALLEQALQPAARIVAVDAGRDEHVRGKSRETARHRPDVQVVYLDDLGIVDERPRDGVGIDPGRRGLEEDPT